VLSIILLGVVAWRLLAWVARRRLDEGKQ